DAQPHPQPRPLQTMAAYDRAPRARGGRHRRVGARRTRIRSRPHGTRRVASRCTTHPRPHHQSEPRIVTDWRQRLRDIIKRKGYKQYLVAEDAGITNVTLSRTLTNPRSNPYLSTIVRIAYAIDE